MDPEKRSLNFIFPTKYVIPKSLKFSHWPSKKTTLQQFLPNDPPFWVSNFKPPGFFWWLSKGAQISRPDWRYTQYTHLRFCPVFGSMMQQISTADVFFCKTLQPWRCWMGTGGSACLHGWSKEFVPDDQFQSSHLRLFLWFNLFFLILTAPWFNWQ